MSEEEGESPNHSEKESTTERREDSMGRGKKLKAEETIPKDVSLRQLISSLG